MYCINYCHQLEILSFICPALCVLCDRNLPEEKNTKYNHTKYNHNSSFSLDKQEESSKLLLSKDIKET
jgi:hypothetical protein